MSIPTFQAGYPFSFRTYSGDGSTRIFAIPFPYLAQAHVKVYIGGTLQLSGYSWNTEGSIQFDVAPPAPTDDQPNILVRRETPVNPLVVYVNAASLKASNINVTARQSLYIAQEVADYSIGGITVGQEVLDARDEAVAAAAAAAISRDDAADSATLTAASEALAAAAAAQAQAIVDALSSTYDVAISVPFLPAAGETVAAHAVVRDVTMPAGATGSWIGTSDPGTQDLVVTLYKNGVSFGTATIPATTLGNLPSIPSATSFVLGDILTAKVTSANPSAAATFGLTLKFTLDFS